HEIDVKSAWRCPPGGTYWVGRYSFVTVPGDHRIGWSQSAAPLYAFSSPLEQPHDLGLCQSVEMQVEADHRCRGVGFHRQSVGAHGEHREQIAVRMVALRRARPAIAGRAEIRARR